MGQISISVQRYKLLLITALVYLVVWFTLHLVSMLQYRLSIPPKGFYHSHFKPVASAFRQNFEKGLEREGANLAIIHNGQVVLNLWNGYSDSESLREWSRHTKTVLFSTTKAIAALCLAVQINDGRLFYDDLIIKYWPEYGQHGKHLTTVEDILTHRAGIPYIENITIADLANPKRMIELLEQAKPIWKPGTTTGYHAMTFGWLVDCIFRKVDTKGRDVQTFLQEEIANKYGIDVSIGIKKKDFNNLARATQPGLIDYIRDVFLDLRLILMLLMMYGQPSNSLAAKLRIHPPWLPLNYDTMALNDPSIAELNIAAVTGVSDAYNLAKLFSLAINGTLLDNHTLSQVKQPTMLNWHVERVILYPFVKGHGFFFEKHPTKKNSYLFGHPGYGCQALDVDIDNKLVIAYVTNGLKTGSGRMCKAYQTILRAVYEVI